MIYTFEDKMKLNCYCVFNLLSVSVFLVLLIFSSNCDSKALRLFAPVANALYLQSIGVSVDSQDSKAQFYNNNVQLVPLLVDVCTKKSQQQDETEDDWNSRIFPNLFFSFTLNSGIYENIGVIHSASRALHTAPDTPISIYTKLTEYVQDYTKNHYTLSGGIYHEGTKRNSFSSFQAINRPCKANDMTDNYNYVYFLIRQDANLLSGGKVGIKAHISNEDVCHTGSALRHECITQTPVDYIAVKPIDYTKATMTNEKIGHVTAVQSLADSGFIGIDYNSNDHTYGSPGEACNDAPDDMDLYEDGLVLYNDNGKLSCKTNIISSESTKTTSILVKHKGDTTKIYHAHYNLRGGGTNCSLINGAVESTTSNDSNVNWDDGSFGCVADGGYITESSRPMLGMGDWYTSNKLVDHTLNTCYFYSKSGYHERCNEGEASHADYAINNIRMTESLPPICKWTYYGYL